MMTLPTDSEERKTYPLFSALFGYFGAALAAVAHHSWKSNEKHNPGQPVHWAIDKSTDHANCVLRHALDLGDILGEIERNGSDTGKVKTLLEEADALAWRALALSQTLRLKYTATPLPFNARRSEPESEEACFDCETTLSSN